MNHVYRLVISRVTGTLIVVAENVRGRSKSKSKTGAVVNNGPPSYQAFFIQPLCVMVALIVSGQAYALPQNGVVQSGVGTISSTTNAMTINQASSRLSINWDSFNIGANQSVQFNQRASDVALNRVVGSDASQIFGRLTATGQVFILNPNGILFGAGAQVNVGGLVASTGRLSDADFQAGRYNFTGADKFILNQGNITAADGGYIALLAPDVQSTGVISARLGTALLAAGDKINLEINNGSLLSFQVEQGSINALVDNKNLVEADGGRVFMSARAAQGIATAVVNNSGVVQARTIENHNGVIRLMADMVETTDSNGTRHVVGDAGRGQVNLSGALDASAPTGGDGGMIETSAAQVHIANTARVTTQSRDGKTGEWLIDPLDFTISAGGDSQTSSGIGASTLATNLGTSQVTITTDASTGGHGDIFVNGAVAWSANKLTLSAHRNIDINANLDGSGTAQLSLQYGQASSDGASASVNLASDVAVSLPAGDNFFTKQGASGLVKTYTVINSLGAEGSTTTQDLQGMHSGLSKNYALGADIDASDTANWNDGAGFSPIGLGSTFSGRFNGLGHTINYLTINRPSDTGSVGLFSEINYLGVIENVGLINANVVGSSNVGGLLGYNYGTVRASYVTGSVSGAYEVGGLVGYNQKHIINSYANVVVGGTEDVGGLVGQNSDSGYITNSYALGNVSGLRSVGGLVGVNNISLENSYASGDVIGSVFTGGLVGFNSGTINTSYASGNVTGLSDRVGGLVGEDGGTINDGYATGNVFGLNAVGGLVGKLSFGEINRSYASGRVHGMTNSTGGFVGDASSGSTMVGSYWDKTTSGMSNGIGVDQGASVADVTSMTTQEMLHLSQVSSFSGFDFSGSGKWWSIDGNTRPFLRMEYSTNIVNAHQLQMMAMNLSASYKIIANIDASETSRPSGMWGSQHTTVDRGLVSGFIPIGNEFDRFTGSLDGQGYLVNHLMMHQASADNVGLFGYVDGATITRVGLNAVDVVGRDNVGGLVGYNSEGSISASFATGTVVGESNVGGLVGENSGQIVTSYASADVTGINKVGGLVGLNWGGTIRDTYALGSVHNNALSGLRTAGGLVGANGISDGGNTLSSTIETSYATGELTQLTDSGSIGGLVGENGSGSHIINSYWDNVTTGFSSVGVGFNGDSSTMTLTGLSTLQMMQSSNFTGFDFSDSGAWWNAAGNTRPFLRAEYSTRVMNAHQLQLIAMNLSANYTLGADIDMAELTSPSGMWGTATALMPTGVSTGFSPIGDGDAAFSGTFDGLGHTVNDLMINRPVDGGFVFVGLFGDVDGTLKNVGLVGGSITSSSGIVGGEKVGYSASGPLAGVLNYGAVVSNSYATTAVKNGAVAGGLVGAVNHGAIINSYATGDVEGVLSGGLLGAVASGSDFSGTISNSYATGNVTGYAAGGLVGFMSGGLIANSYATGNVSALDIVGVVVPLPPSAGGLAGFSEANIVNSYATGQVSGSSSDIVGGLVGIFGGLFSGHDSFTISASYATGEVTGGLAAGGLVGYLSAGDVIKQSYASGRVDSNAETGSDVVGGLVGANSGTIYDTYALGSVFGLGSVGGLVGENSSGATISNSYATGRVFTSEGNAGGLIGNNLGNVTNSYWDQVTSGLNVAVGTGSSSGISALNTIAMMQSSHFSGFDFDNVWWNLSGNTRPFLRMEYSTSITNAHQLQLVAMNLAASYTLANDISMSEVYRPSGMWGTEQEGTYTGVTTGFVPLGNESTVFTGGFNGKDHKITSLMINRPLQDYIGLFGKVGSDVLVQHVGLESIDVLGGHQVGGLVGLNDGTVDTSYAMGFVRGYGADEEDTHARGVGGLVGVNFSVVNHSYASSSVSGENKVGGLVGLNLSSIVNSYATGTVSGVAGVGGLLGFNDNGSVMTSYASGDVIGTNNIGGLVGFVKHGVISDTYALGSVSGMGVVGGLVGGLGDPSRAPIISNSYSTGRVTGGEDYTGGLVGYVDGESTITNSYWDTVTSGTNISVGHIGTSASVSAHGLTTMQSMQSSQFTGFDFDSNGTWWNIQGNTRPFLRMEYERNITNAHQVQLMSMLPSVAYTLRRDVDMQEVYSPFGMWGTQVSLVSTGVSTGFVPIGDEEHPFVGILDGKDYSLSSLMINRTTNNIGLFGLISQGTVTNLNVQAADISGASYVGGIAGYNDNGVISNSSISGTITGDDVGISSLVGGVVGHNAGLISNVHSGAYAHGEDRVGGVAGDNVGTIFSTYATGLASGSTKVGGLVGVNDTYGSLVGVISYSGTALTVTADENHAGGLAGFNAATITHSYSASNVTGHNIVGGLVGENNGDSTTISYSYVPGGNVSGIDQVGGLVGVNTLGGKVDHSYAVVGVTGNDFVGGLVGDNFSGSTISNSYAKGNVSAVGAAGGLVGRNTGESSINASYATGSVTGTTGLIGALIGDNQGVISNSYWNSDVMSTLAIGTGAGETTYLSGLTTDQMLHEENFTRFDISNVGGTKNTWRIYESNSTPLIRGLLEAVRLNGAAATYNGDWQFGPEIGTRDIVTAGATIFSTSSTQSTGKHVGTYINAYSSQLGHDIIGANLSIAPADVTLESSVTSRTYNGTTTISGSAVSASGAIFSGDSITGGIFVFNDKNVGTEKTITGSAATIGDGTYTSDYNISYVTNTTGTISKAALSITAHDASAPVGAPYSGGNGVSYSGFAGEDSADSDLTGTLSYTGSSQGATTVGSYAITPQGLSAQNYDITYHDGELLITQAPFDDELRNMLIRYSLYSNNFVNILMHSSVPLATVPDKKPSSLEIRNLVLLYGGIKLPDDDAVHPNVAR